VTTAGNFEDFFKVFPVAKMFGFEKVEKEITDKKSDKVTAKLKP
jgi:hypothetical protein